MQLKHPAEYFKGLHLMPTSLSSAELTKLDPILRQRTFFSARMEGEKLLEGLRSFVRDCAAHGVNEGEFLARVRRLLREHKELLPEGMMGEIERMDSMTPKQIRAYERSVRHFDSLARLRLIYRTQAEMCAGWNQYRLDMEPRALAMYPGWLFYRRPGAKTFRPDHVEHEGEIRLKTDVQYWLERNSADQGGFELPYPPFGFNSWMWVEPVSRGECVRLGLCGYKDTLGLPDELRKKYGLDEEHAMQVLKELLGKLCKYPQEGEPQPKEQPKQETPPQTPQDEPKTGEQEPNTPKRKGRQIELWRMPESVMEEYAPSGTREEAIQRAQRLVQDENGASFHADTSKEVIDEFCATMEQLIMRHRITPNTLETKVLDDKHRAVTIFNIYSHKTSIKLNQDEGTRGIYSHDEPGRYKDSETFKRRTVSSSVNGGSLQVTTTHEYGHLVHFRAMNGDWREPHTLDEAGRRAYYAATSALEKARQKKEDGTCDIYALSKYGNSEPIEYFAECFAARSRGETLPPYANQMIDTVLAIARERQAAMRKDATPKDSPKETKK